MLKIGSVRNVAGSLDGLAIYFADTIKDGQASFLIFFQRTAKDEYKLDRGRDGTNGL